MKKEILICLFICLFSGTGQTQILFSESFAVLLDSTRKFKGSFTPEVKIQTQKRLLVEISSLTDLVFRIKNNSLLVAQKFELTTFGGERALESGFLYLKWKANKTKRWMPEYYGQIQWVNGLGLSHQSAIGINIRHALFRDSKKGLFGGVGGFYEYENWNYNGVEEELLPIDQTSIKTHNWKANFYLNYKTWFSNKFFLDIGTYYQARFDQIFETPRIAFSTEFSWQLTEHIQLLTRYQPLYDVQPIVPIRKWFHQFTTTFSLSF